MNDALTKSIHTIHPFDSDDAHQLRAEGYEATGKHSMRRQAGRAVFVVHVGSTAPGYDVYTLDSYETPSARSGTASFSSVSLSEVLQMVDLLSKFWGVS